MVPNPAAVAPVEKRRENNVCQERYHRTENLSPQLLMFPAIAAGAYAKFRSGASER
jgi:hypothetical protein